MFPGTLLNIQWESFKTSTTIGKTKETKTTKEVKAKTIKNNRDPPQQKKRDCQTHAGQSGHGSESIFVVALFGFLDGF